jgi:hypothetical protein
MLRRPNLKKKNGSKQSLNGPPSWPLVSALDLEKNTSAGPTNGASPNKSGPVVLPGQSPLHTPVHSRNLETSHQRDNVTDKLLHPVPY